MAVDTLDSRCTTTRRAWLAATQALAEHADDCLSCLCEWLPGCDEGRALRQAADEALDRYSTAVLP